MTRSWGVASLVEFVLNSPRLFVLTGAGCSTPSGIPDYRDEGGRWKRPQPVTFHDFVNKPKVRARYWARSMVGWERFGNSKPNAAHDALAALERAGYVEKLVTQNVDGLHQAAGSRDIVDLHGRMDYVRCLACGAGIARGEFQSLLGTHNPAFAFTSASIAPDGDADLAGAHYDEFRVPPCSSCGGLLKPDVVFFGETVPRGRVDNAFGALGRASGVLAVGSSLTVFSGYRFVREAARRGLPIAIVNAGKTRADDLDVVKVVGQCEALLPELVQGLLASKSSARRPDASVLASDG